MPFNVSTFKSEISDYGYLQNNKYQVFVTPPQIIQNQNNVNQRMLFRADYVNLPSVSLAIVDIPRYGVGINQKQPHNAAFNTMNLSFISDGYGDIWNFWYNWTRSIFQFSGSDNGTGNLTNSSGNYSLEYKDNYSTTISVVVFDNYGNDVQTIDFTQAFPYSIDDIQLSWNNTNQLLKINVAVAYTDYMIVGI